MPYGRRALAPERQRKTDALNEAMGKRGYAISTWRGLSANAGGWQCEIVPLKGSPDPLKVGGYGRLVREASYEDLLALFTEDLLWAQHIYRQRSENLDDKACALAYAERQARAEYERACVFLAVTRCDNPTSQGLVRASERREEAEGKFIEAHRATEAARRKVEEYLGAMPSTDEEARAYLASLEKGE